MKLQPCSSSFLLAFLFASSIYSQAVFWQNKYLHDTANNNIKLNNTFIIFFINNYYLYLHIYEFLFSILKTNYVKICLMTSYTSTVNYFLIFLLVFYYYYFWKRRIDYNALQLHIAFNNVILHHAKHISILFLSIKLSFFEIIKSFPLKQEI